MTILTLLIGRDLGFYRILLVKFDGSDLSTCLVPYVGFLEGIQVWLINQSGSNFSVHSGILLSVLSTCCFIVVYYVLVMYDYYLVFHISSTAVS